jgi:HEAT repeat protein
MQTLPYKRSFVTVRAGLGSPDAAIVEEASKAMKGLYFPHAIDPLSRILRESPQPAVRAAALWALARIDTLEAAEIVLRMLEHGTPADHVATLAAVKDARGTKLVELARAELPSATAALQARLREALSLKGLES